jgi:hypothetical protein
MPEVDDEDDSVLCGLIPGFVLEVVVEHQTPTLLPAPGGLADAERAVSVGHQDPEMTPHSHVRRPTVGTDMGVGPHPRHVDQPGRAADRRQRLDPAGCDWTGLAHLVAPAAAFVKEHDIPVAGSLETLTLTVEPGPLEREHLVPDLLEVGLQIAGQREGRCIVPRP